MPNFVGGTQSLFSLKNNILLYEPRNGKNGAFISIYTCTHQGGKERGLWVNALSKRLFEI